ncbi:metal-dependent transcriptional regulator [Amedibacillus sp. YH-ame10]
MNLGESLEDYLETLLILEEQHGKIRCVDVATLMQVSKPSVNKAMNVLKEKGYVLQESYGDIHFTKSGKTLAIEIYNRHKTITKFLHEVLGVDEKTADEEACHIEHVISEETFQKIASFK